MRPLAPAPESALASSNRADADVCEPEQDASFKVELQTPFRSVGPNLVLPCIASFLLAGFVTAYIVAPWLYFRLFASFASPYPFLDIAAVVAGICHWREGVDVFVPADLLNASPGLGVYSPIWLWFPCLPEGRGWINLYGLAAALAFITALAGLPRARSRAGNMIMLPALVSPPVLFAIERANVDLLMFALTMLVIVLMERSFPLRVAGYAVAEVAALLKYYPLVLIGFVVQERLNRSIVIVLLVALTFGAYVYINSNLVLKIFQAVPLLASGNVAFGADTLVQSIRNIVHQTAGIQLPFSILKSIFIAAAVLMAFAISSQTAMSSALERLAPRELHCLTAGSLLLCFCFFAAVNLPYREVFALLVLPGLVASAETEDKRLGAVAWAVAADAVLVVLWTQPQFPASATALVSVGYATIREAARWFMVTILMATVICFFDRTQSWRQLTSRCCI